MPRAGAPYRAWMDTDGRPGVGGLRDTREPHDAREPRDARESREVRETRELLLRERADAVARLEGAGRERAAIVEAARDAAADDEHDPEGATIAYERAQVTALEQAAAGRLAEVDAALARLAAGSYGRCERCGQPIPAGRLAARPTARRCAGCAGLGA